MADLGGPASNGNGAGRGRPMAGVPNPTGSPSGIRSPRMIMQDRQAREEARRRAEQERIELQRAQAEQEAVEDSQRRNAERRAAAAAGGATNTGGDLPTPGQRLPAAATQTRPQVTSARPPAAATAQTGQRPSRGGTTAQPAAENFANLGGGARSGNTAPQAAEASTAGGARTRSSFPHAFERWETLSAHWEGLTSFWIRRLEQNTEELNNNPISQQLSRQVTDLSAAGANLFHAVVELQRLRASSERKFQRWFFDTRAELERAQEVNAMLERALDEERRGRADAIRDAVEQERANSKTQKQLTEMRKELQISKDEARRAWEELGRREQEERDRTLALQSGQPTIVGGVQVIPMPQNLATRGGASYDREYYDGRYGAQGESSYSQAPPTTSGPATSGGGGYYQQPPQGAYSGTGSEGGYSEGEYAIDAHGNFIRDAQGNKIPFRAVASPRSDSDAGAEDFETPASHPGYGSQGPSTSTAGAYAPPEPAYDAEDPYYGGRDAPRHQHQSRLSDVIEEEEDRSRTSASHISRG